MSLFSTHILLMGGEWVPISLRGSRRYRLAVDTGGRDTGGWDTGWKSHLSTIMGVNSSWGLCYDQLTRDGWNDMSALESCTDLATAYGLKMNFHSGMGCSQHQTVGECHIEQNVYFSASTVTRYNRDAWRLEDAQKACVQAKGAFFRH